MNQPEKTDFKNFSDNFFNFARSINALLSDPDRINDEWSDFLDEPVLKWLQEQEGFNSALKTLSFKNVIPSQINTTSDAIFLANICSIVFQVMIEHIDQQTTLKVTKESTRKKALKPVNTLLNLLNDDLQLDNYSDGFELRKLLETLQDQLTGKAPTSYPKENKGGLLDRELITRIYDLLMTCFNDAPTTAIIHLSSMYGIEIKERQINRHLQNHKKYLYQLNEYKKLKESRNKLINALIESKKNN